MNDEEILSMLRRSLHAAAAQDGAYLAETPETIMARARRRLLRRGAAGAGLGAVLLAVGVGTAFGAGSHPASPGPAAGSAVHVSEPGWSVSTGAHGVVYVTIRELANPAKIRKALARAGVPARIVVGKLCSAKDGSLPDNNGAMVLTQRHGVSTLAIYPARMPRGSELLISVVFQHGHIATGEFALIRKGAPLTCSPLVVVPSPVPSPSPTSVPSPSGPAAAGIPVPSPSISPQMRTPVPTPTGYAATPVPTRT